MTVAFVSFPLGSPMPDESPTYEVVEPEPYSEPVAEPSAETVSEVALSDDQFSQIMTVQSAQVANGFFACALLCLLIGAVLGFVLTRDWRV